MFNVKKLHLKITSMLIFFFHFLDKVTFDQHMQFFLNFLMDFHIHHLHGIQL